MLEFGESIYYIDLKAFDTAISIKYAKSETTTETEEKLTFDENGRVKLHEKYTKSIPKSKEIDPTKYDLLKSLLDYIIDYNEISDDTLGAERALTQTPFPFKLAFNTLYSQGIIKEEEK